MPEKIFNKPTSYKEKPEVRKKRLTKLGEFHSRKIRQENPNQNDLEAIKGAVVEFAKKNPDLDLGITKIAAELKISYPFVVKAIEELGNAGPDFPKRKANNKR